jgi:protein-S-isoprenylcysteine O-methyltransferase Ste14
MEGNDNNSNAAMSHEHFKKATHSIFAHSYYLYFLLFLVGVTLDLIFPIKIFTSPVVEILGLIFLIFSTFIIIWEVRTDRELNVENLSKQHFCKGPYCYTRHPGHWGIFFLVLGFGLVVNAFFIIFLTVLSFVITKLVYIKKHESIALGRYGAPYEEYKKSVRF